MQSSIVRTFPEPIAFTRTGSRAARVGTFVLETWSRLLVDGSSSTPRSRARELSWIAENSCALHGIRPSIHGRIPREPCVLVANHMSYFDPMILASMVPLTAIAKREVAGWPLIGELGRRLGVLYVGRDCGASGARVLREAIGLLEEGVSVLVFPEGTTTTGDRVLPFRRGIFGAAAIAGVPVVPVALRYDRPDAAWVGDTYFLPHYVRAMSHACTRVGVHFLEPLVATSPKMASDVAEQARYAIARSLNADDFGARGELAALDDVWAPATA